MEQFASPVSGRSIAPWSAARIARTSLAAAVVWASIAALGLCVGSTRSIGWAPSIAVLRYRLEVVLLASLIGAALSSAGVVYQAILHNPLADPYLLGVSGGASLCAYAWRFPVAGVWAASLIYSISQQAFAFIGAMTVVAIVLGVAHRRGRIEPVTLLLVGVLMNSLCGALFLLLNALHPEILAGSGNAMNFLVGGIQTSLTGAQEYSAACVTAIGFFLMLYLAGQLNLTALDDAQARSLGVRIERLRWIAIATASIVTAAAVSISGPIGFVGLICPHIARRIVGADHRALLPWSTALGAALLCLADAASRLLTRQNLAGTQLPVGVLTALLGAPFFLSLLWKIRRLA